MPTAESIPGKISLKVRDGEVRGFAEADALPTSHDGRNSTIAHRNLQELIREKRRKTVEMIDALKVKELKPKRSAKQQRGKLK